MDVLDFITSQRVLVSKIKEPSPPHVQKEQLSDEQKYEKLWRELKDTIRRENGKKFPCRDTLQRATEQLKALRKKMVASDMVESRKAPVVSCLGDTSPASTGKRHRDWIETTARRKEKARTRKFVFRMPAGNSMGTDASIGMQRLKHLNDKLNKNTRGILDEGPPVFIAGVPQPMDRFNSRPRHRK